jgi:hypothetical protein
MEKRADAGDASGGFRGPFELNMGFRSTERFLSDYQRKENKEMDRAFAPARLTQLYAGVSPHVHVFGG